MPVGHSVSRVSRGSFSAALANWTRAWALAKDDPTPYGRAVADDAMGERLAFAAELGSVPLLESLLAEAGEPAFRGKAVERVTRARGVLATLQHHPDATRSCGRLALAFLWTAAKSSPTPALLTTPGHDDRTLGELRSLGARVGLDMDLVVSPPDAPPSSPPSCTSASCGRP